jgi:hypothetical protein
MQHDIAFVEVSNRFAALEDLKQRWKLIVPGK